MTWGGCFSTTRELKDKSEWSHALLPVSDEGSYLLSLYLWIRTCKSCPRLSWSSGIGSPISISSCLSFPFTPSSCSHLTEKETISTPPTNTWSQKLIRKSHDYSNNLISLLPTNVWPVTQWHKFTFSHKSALAFTFLFSEQTNVLVISILITMHFMTSSSPWQYKAEMFGWLISWLTYLNKDYLIMFEKYSRKRCPGHNHQVCSGLRLSSKGWPMVALCCSHLHTFSLLIKRLWHWSRQSTHSFSSWKRFYTHTHTKIVMIKCHFMNKSEWEMMQTVVCVRICLL